MSSRVIPGLRYRDAHAAIAWLEKVFGFERRAIYDGPDGAVGHAELTLGGGMIMLGSVRDTPDEIRQPDELEMSETQAPYLVVEDARATHARAMSAGVKSIKAPEQMPYGGWAFSCRDPEGHLWNVGEYNPWAPPAVSP